MIEDFLPTSVLDALRRSLAALTPLVHRSHIPTHKKSGSVSAEQLESTASIFGDIYRSPALLNFFTELAGQRLSTCPDDDPHSHALYFYSEPGDHIGYHYDTSFYKGMRFTALVGIVDDSSCCLEYQLHRDDRRHKREVHSVALAPGSLVFFNGDTLYHRVTPLGMGELRIVLTMEFVTSTSMNALNKLVSKCKDAVAYFGWRSVFRSQST